MPDDSKCGYYYYLPDAATDAAAAAATTAAACASANMGRWRWLQVAERVEIFEETWDKVQSASNANQKDKCM